PAPDRNNPFDIFDVGVRALRESPLAERDKVILETLASLKLRPGRKFDLRAFNDAERRALRAGIDQGLAEIRAAAARMGRTSDGWTYAEHHLGNFGDDFVYRAVVALTGLGALEPAEAVYVPCNIDSSGRPLSGAHRYELAFPADALPPARAFW